MSSRAAWTAKYDATAEPGPKYHNKPNRCSSNVMHQSKLEARRCTELHLMQQGGLLHSLEAHPQPLFRLDVNGHHICSYRPDFLFVTADGETVVEDTKGMVTDVYRIKKKLLKALYDLDVKEVRR